MPHGVYLCARTLAFPTPITNMDAQSSAVYQSTLNLILAPSVLLFQVCRPEPTGCPFYLSGHIWLKDTAYTVELVYMLG